MVCNGGEICIFDSNILDILGSDSGVWYILICDCVGDDGFFENGVWDLLVNEN